jgi:hypothetical protein
MIADLRQFVRESLARGVARLQKALPAGVPAVGPRRR